MLRYAEKTSFLPKRLLARRTATLLQRTEMVMLADGKRIRCQVSANGRNCSGRCPSAHVQIIPNGVDTQFFSAAQISGIRRNTQAPVRKPSILFCWFDGLPCEYRGGYLVYPRNLAGDCRKASGIGIRNRRSTSFPGSASVGLRADSSYRDRGRCATFLCVRSRWQCPSESEAAHDSRYLKPWQLGSRLSPRD